MIIINDNKIAFTNQVVTLEDNKVFQTAFTRLINDGHDEIQIDMTKITFIPSSLIGFLIDKKKQLMKKDKALEIIAINDALKGIFDNMKISEFFGV